MLVELSSDERAELRRWSTARRCRRRWRRGRGSCCGTPKRRRKKDIAALAGVSPADGGPVAGSVRARRVWPACSTGGRGAGREQVPAWVRGRVLALTRMSPPAGVRVCRTGPAGRWPRYVNRTEGVTVSHSYVAKLWREQGLRPHRHGTFKLSRDPQFADEGRRHRRAVSGPAGRCGGPSDRREDARSRPWTAPSRCCRSSFGATEKRTHDYVRHGTTNLFAALNVATGEVYRRMPAHPQRRGLPGVPEERGQAPHAAARCTWCWTTCPPTARPTSWPGWPRTPRALPFHPDRIRPGSTRSRPGSASSPGNPSAAAPSPPSQALSTGSATTSPTWNSQPPTLRLDRHRRRDPRQGPDRPDQRQETRRRTTPSKANRITRH